MQCKKNNSSVITPVSQIVSPHKFKNKDNKDNTPTFMRNCFYYFTEYSQNTTIHGLKYVMERGRSLFEKICWMIIVIISLSICISLIWNIYQKWVGSPVIVSFTTIGTPIYELPFPAVTICPEVKSNCSLFNYTDVYLKLKTNRTITATQWKHFQYMSLVCITPPELLDTTMKIVDEEAIDYLIKPISRWCSVRADDATRLDLRYSWCSEIRVFTEHPVSSMHTELQEQATLEIPFDEMMFDLSLVKKESVRFCSEASPHFEDYCYDVQWTGKQFYEHRSKLFSPIITSEGLCYTFNIFDGTELFTDIVKYPDGCYTTNGEHSEWSPEMGYSKDSDLDAYPRRTLVAGIKGGLKIKLRFFKDHIDHACGNSLQGYKVTLHQPIDFPRIKHNYFRVPLQHSVVAAIKPNIMITSPDLRDYTVADRQCYFESERQLKIFRIYSQQNCYVECLANFTHSLCGCVDFHMPREASTPICGVGSLECIEHARLAFLIKDIPQNIKASKMSKLNKKYDNSKIMDDSNKCNCLPSCHSIHFDTETSQTGGKWKEMLSIAVESGDVDETYHSDLQDEKVYLTELNLFFKSMQFVAVKRSALYGHTDFWANVGGIIGLFTGFSFISMFEILYYLSLRIYCNIKRHGLRHWSGAPELIDENRHTFIR